MHASNLASLKKIGITHIINAAAKDCRNYHTEHFEYLSIPIDDWENENISIYFEKAHEFIENARKKNGKVLIHCMGKQIFFFFT